MEGIAFEKKKKKRQIYFGGKLDLAARGKVFEREKICQLGPWRFLATLWMDEALSGCSSTGKLRNIIFGQFYF